MSDDLARLVERVEREEWGRFVEPPAKLRHRGDRRRRVRRRVTIAASAVVVVAVMLGGIKVAGLGPGNQNDRTKRDAELASGGACRPPAHPAATADRAAPPLVERGPALPASVTLAPADLGAGWQQVRTYIGQLGRVPGAVYFLSLDATALPDALLRAQERVRFAELRTDPTRPARNIETRVVRYGQDRAAEAFAVLKHDATCQLKGFPSPSPVGSGRDGDAEWIVVRYEPVPSEKQSLDAGILRSTGGWRVVARAGDLVARADIRPMDVRDGPTPDPSLTRQWVTAIGAAVAARLAGKPSAAVPPVTDLPSNASSPPKGLLQPSDLGTGWQAGEDERQVVRQVEVPNRDCKDTSKPLAGPGYGQMYRSTTPDGREWVLYEQVLPMRPGDAEGVMSAVRASVPPRCHRLTNKILTSGSGIAGDDAVVLVSTQPTNGSQTVWVRVGNTIVHFDTLPGGAAGGVPLPGGTAWTTAVAKKAAQRAAALG